MLDTVLLVIGIAAIVGLWCGLIGYMLWTFDDEPADDQ